MSEAAAPPRWRRVLGFAAGLILLLAALAVVLSRRDDAARAWGSVANASPALIALALVLPVLNILVTSMSFWVQMRRFGRIGPGEMTALIGVAWLLNYLPLRPGMFGRLAYHKAVNGIALKDSVSAMVIGMAFGAGAVLVVVAIAAALAHVASPLPWSLALAAPAVLSGVAIGVTGRARWLPAVFLCRYADMLIWVLRYWVVFRLVGAPVGLASATAIAAVCQLSLNIPLVGNGMGLREWAVGVTAANLPPGLFGSGPNPQMAVGLAADLVNRIAELAVALPMGLLCAAWLAARQRNVNPPAADPRNPS